MIGRSDGSAGGVGSGDGAGKQGGDAVDVIARAADVVVDRCGWHLRPRDPYKIEMHFKIEI